MQQHIVVLHYYSEQEVERYLKIAQFLEKFSRCNAQYQFLLVSASCREPSERMLEAFSRIAQPRTLRCERTAHGHMDGANSGFFEALDYVNKHYEHDGGFVLWLESDMLPIKPNWIDLLEKEWHSLASALVMGLYLPRFSLRLPPHFNGGACYPKDLFARLARLDPDFKDRLFEKSFDMSLSQYYLKTRKYRKSKSFALSHRYSLCEDVSTPEKLVLHGLFSPDINEFISAGIRLLEDPAFLIREKKRIRSLPRREKQCCKYWNRPLGMCPIHDGVDSLHKRGLCFAYRAMSRSTSVLWKKTTAMFDNSQ